MTIREITVGGLMDFIRSEDYSKMNPKPITPSRAVSQAKNPAARPEDIALVYISDNNKLLAFAGILPDEAEGQSETIYSNSGWWVHPEHGRSYGLQVFFKALQNCHLRMFFTDCSAYTKSILEKSGLFSFREPVKGLRYILRSYSAELFRRRNVNRIISFVFSIADVFLNYFVAFRIKSWRKRNSSFGYSFYSVDKIDEDLNGFIRKHSSDYYLKQDGEKLNWIVQNSWLITDNVTPAVSYPFSYITCSFKQEFLVVQNKGQIVAVLLLSLRDNHATIPYVYYDCQHLSQVLKILLNYLFQLKIFSLVVFNHKVLRELENIGMPSFINLKVSRHFGYSKELNDVFSGDKLFQDGEGDVAFT